MNTHIMAESHRPITEFSLSRSFSSRPPALGLDFNYRYLLPVIVKALSVKEPPGWFDTSSITRKSKSQACALNRHCRVLQEPSRVLYPKPILIIFSHRLLKKTDLYTYKSDQGHRTGEIQRRYGVTDVEYNTYNALCGSMRKLAHKLSQLEPEDPTRRKLESAMLEKLHSMGIIEKSREQGGALSQVERLTVSAICRRRLPIVMVREQKMIQYVDKVSLLPLSYSKTPNVPDSCCFTIFVHMQRTDEVDGLTWILAYPMNRLSRPSRKVMSALVRRLFRILQH